MHFESWVIPKKPWFGVINQCSANFLLEEHLKNFGNSAAHLPENLKNHYKM